MARSQQSMFSQSYALRRKHREKGLFICSINKSRDETTYPTIDRSRNSPNAIRHHLFGSARQQLCCTKKIDNFGALTRRDASIKLPLKLFTNVKRTSNGSLYRKSCQYFYGLGEMISGNKFPG